MAKRFPWKSSIRKLTASIQESLDRIDGDLIAIAATKKVRRADIAEGLYSHVGLTMQGGTIVAAGPVQPPADAGKWSGRNAHGWDRKREDWPMVQKSWTFEAPNFGDGARNGWTLHSRTRDVYQNQIFEPQGMTIESSLLEDRGGEQVIVKLGLAPMLSRACRSST